MRFPIKKVNKKDQQFPTLLRKIDDAPHRLYYRGSLLEEEEPAIAIVGTRKATKKGLRMAQEISFRLSKQGIAVISGLALGVDGAAHKGALETNGKTIAVLAGGLDSVYPKKHKNLAKRILNKNGGLVSEHRKGVSPKPNYFLERNRIISGMSLAVVIIEAPARSGTLSTANHALRQGRDVFVLPGPADHPNYEGSHKLIRDGARLVRNVDDIIEDLDRYLNKDKLNF